MAQAPAIGTVAVHCPECDLLVDIPVSTKIVTRGRFLDVTADMDPMREHVGACPAVA